MCGRRGGGGGRAGPEGEADSVDKCAGGGNELGRRSPRAEPGKWVTHAMYRRALV